MEASDTTDEKFESNIIKTYIGNGASSTYTFNKDGYLEYSYYSDVDNVNVVFQAKMSAYVFSIEGKTYD